MKKEFIPYEQALTLKDLGFDEDCFCWWDLHELVYCETSNSKLKKHLIQCSAPLCQQAFRWFREKYDLKYWIATSNKGYVISVKGISIELFEWEKYKTYEEAELACLNRLIEIIKNK